MNRHLHAAAYFLNPQYQYEPDFSCHPEVKLGLFSCMDKLIMDSNERDVAYLQIDDFRGRKGLFGREEAFSTRKKRTPTYWWIAYGSSTPELAKFAVRILSLTCISSGCNHNWNAFNEVHIKKRNRLDQAKHRASVYIMYNKRLKHRHLKREAGGEEVDPLLVDTAESDDEWNPESDGIEEGVEVSQPTRILGLEEPSSWNDDIDELEINAIEIIDHSNDKGKAPMCLVDEEDDDLVDVDSDPEDDGGIGYHYGSSDYPTSDDDDGDDYFL